MHLSVVSSKHTIIQGIQVKLKFRLVGFSVLQKRLGLIRLCRHEMCNDALLTSSGRKVSCRNPETVSGEILHAKTL